MNSILVTSDNSSFLPLIKFRMFIHVMDVWIFLTPPAAKVLMDTEYPFHPIEPFFDSIVPDIISRALSCPINCGNMVLGLILGAIPRNYLRLSALVCILIIVHTLI